VVVSPHGPEASPPWFGPQRGSARPNRKPDDVLGLAGTNFFDEIDKICRLIRSPESLMDLDG
jgi:hypothetical protein